MTRWNPALDGLTDREFVDACDRSGFVATAAALRRAVATVRRAYFRLTLPYEIKCDDCKKVIERTDSLHESACGGRCFACRHAAVAPYWSRAKVGEHWTHPNYPNAVVSTFVRGNPAAGQMRSGYGAWVNYKMVGEFETLLLAQRAVEALAS